MSGPPGAKPGHTPQGHADQYGPTPTRGPARCATVNPAPDYPARGRVRRPSSADSAHVPLTYEEVECSSRGECCTAASLASVTTMERSFAHDRPRRPRHDTGAALSRSPAEGISPAAQRLLELQRSIGNHAVSRLLGRLDLLSPRAPDQLSDTPLDPVTLALTQPRLGHDFSQVPVHADFRATAEEADTNHSTSQVLGISQSGAALRGQGHQPSHVRQEHPGATAQPQSSARW